MWSNDNRSTCSGRTVLGSGAWEREEGGEGRRVRGRTKEMEEEGRKRTYGLQSISCVLTYRCESEVLLLKCL